MVATKQKFTLLILPENSGRCLSFAKQVSSPCQQHGQSILVENIVHCVTNMKRLLRFARHRELPSPPRPLGCSRSRSVPRYRSTGPGAANSLSLPAASSFVSAEAMIILIRMSYMFLQTCASRERRSQERRSHAFER